MSRLLTPADIVATLSKRYKEEWRGWALVQVGHPAAETEAVKWPYTVTLGQPSRKQLDDELEAVGEWADTWKPDLVPDSIEVEWVGRPSRYGPQRLPRRAILPSPRIVARTVGAESAWVRAIAQALLLVEHFPEAEPKAALRELSLLNDRDVQLAVRAARVIRAHPDSGLYPRQLAIPGLDTKWVETHQGVLRSLTSDVTGPDFGLRKVPTTADILLADPAARTRRRLPRSLSVSRDELADFDHGVPVSETVVLVVENRQCAIDLPDFHGLIVLHGLGNSAPELLATTPWVRGAPRVLYWGDMDAAGFSMLQRMRELGITARSLLMDPATFESMLEHATVGKNQVSGRTDLLTGTEKDVVAGILDGRWGGARQVEQEKIPTRVAVAALLATGLERAGAAR